MASAAALVRPWLARAAGELGWTAFLGSPRDTKVLCALRFVRMFAYGGSTLVLALFLAEVGISVAAIGLFMTLTLLGDVVLSLALTLVADKLGRRRILVGGALLMVLSGVCFSLSSSWLILVLASVFGVISPRAIEESTLAQLVPKDVRSDVFAWYMLIGSAGVALGTFSAGSLVQSLESSFGWTQLTAYRAIFVLYSILGLVKAALTLMLSPASEAPQKSAEAAYERVNMTDTTTSSRLNATADGDENDAGTDIQTPARSSVLRRLARLLPDISPTSRGIVAKLSLLMGVDSFASGLVPLSWISYYFTTKFGIDPQVLGTIFFVANLLTSASGLVASSLAKRIGLVRTMVFSHLPSAVFLALIPVPSHVGLAAVLLFLRNSLASMDQAPRQAFIAAAVLSSERTAVMGFVNVVKTLAQSGGPSVTGVLGGEGRFWLVFGMAGALKASYDLAMLRMFLGFRGREEEEGQ